MKARVIFGKRRRKDFLRVRSQGRCTAILSGITPVQVEIGDSPLYEVGKQIGKGSFGQVYLGRRVFGGDENVEGPGALEVALKFEKTDLILNTRCPSNEWNVYDNLGDIDGVVKVHYKGRYGSNNIMIMDILGSSLREVWESSGKFMSAEMVAYIAVESLAILAQIHSKGFVHRDIKPENFLLGKPSSIKEKKLFLVDFGLATKWRDANNQHVKYAQIPGRFSGSILYASINTLLGRTHSRRDDLESLAYSLIFLLQGQLPWQNLQGDEIKFRVARKKMSTSVDALCSCSPAPFREFLDAVIQLKFDEEPNYFKLICIFNTLLGADHHALPLQIDGAQKIIQLYKQRFTLDNNDGAHPKIKVGCGGCLPRWFIVFNGSNHPTTQRCFFNIRDDRLREVVEVGNQQGLCISAVGFSSNSWTIAMDDVNSFTDQVFDLAPSFLDNLHADWIHEKWNNNYQISTLAGASTDDKALIVMSKGTSFAHQCLKVSASFPFEYIRKAWKKGLHVTSMTTVNGWWVVVMSKTSYLDQVVEFDFHYPREGVRIYWDKGYDVTSMATTDHQVAVVLSLSSTNHNPQFVRRGGGVLTEEAMQKYWTKKYHLICLCRVRCLM